MEFDSIDRPMIGERPRQPRRLTMMTPIPDSGRIMRPNTFTPTSVPGRSAPDFRRLRQLDIQNRGILTRSKTASEIAGSFVTVKRPNAATGLMEDKVITLAELLAGIDAGARGQQEALIAIRDRTGELARRGDIHADAAGAASLTLAALVSEMIRHIDALTPAGVGVVADAIRLLPADESPIHAGFDLVYMQKEFRDAPALRDAVYAYILSEAVKRSGPGLGAADVRAPIRGVTGMQQGLTTFMRNADTVGIGTYSHRAMDGTRLGEQILTEVALWTADFNTGKITTRNLLSPGATVVMQELFRAGEVSEEDMWRTGVLRIPPADRARLEIPDRPDAAGPFAPRHDPDDRKDDIVVDLDADDADAGVPDDPAGPAGDPGGGDPLAALGVRPGDPDRRRGAFGALLGRIGF